MSSTPSASPPRGRLLVRPSFSFRSRWPVLSAFALLSIAVLMTGCESARHWTPGFVAAYQPDVQQGNVVTREMVDQLRPGISKDQVRFMLGTPLLVSSFRPDRWDYVYFLKRQNSAPQSRHLVVWFAEGKLDRFETDEMPPEALADNLILGRKPTAVPKAPPKEPAPQITLPTTK